MEGRGEPRNFANWPAEFGKIFRGKLRALLIAVSRCVYAGRFKILGANLSCPEKKLVDGLCLVNMKINMSVSQKDCCSE